MSTDNVGVDFRGDIKDAFPAVDPGVVPLGNRVLVQLRRLKNQTTSGIVIVQETQDTAKWNNQVAKVVGMGPMAYRNRETNAFWPEGAWVQPGDYIRVPRWNGDRIEVPVKGRDEPVTFVIFNDYEIIAKVTGDPLKQKIYVL